MEKQNDISNASVHSHSRAAAGSVCVGDKVMILGGMSKLRGLIGTVSCRKSDADYVNVYIPEMGKYILHIGDLLKQNTEIGQSDEQPTK